MIDCKSVNIQAISQLSVNFLVIFQLSVNFDISQFCYANTIILNTKKSTTHYL